MAQAPRGGEEPGEEAGNEAEAEHDGGRGGESDEPDGAIDRLTGGPLGPVAPDERRGEDEAQAEGDGADERTIPPPVRAGTAAQGAGSRAVNAAATSEIAAAMKNASRV